MKASEESAGRAYLVLWKWSEAERISGSVWPRASMNKTGGKERKLHLQTLNVGFDLYMANIPSLPIKLRFVFFCIQLDRDNYGHK